MARVLGNPPPACLSTGQVAPAPRNVWVCKTGAALEQCSLTAPQGGSGQGWRCSCHAWVVAHKVLSPHHLAHSH